MLVKIYSFTQFQNIHSQLVNPDGCWDMEIWLVLTGLFMKIWEDCVDWTIHNTVLDCCIIFLFLSTKDHSKGHIFATIQIYTKPLRDYHNYNIRIATHINFWRQGGIKLAWFLYFGRNFPKKIFFWKLDLFSESSSNLLQVTPLRFFMNVIIFRVMAISNKFSDLEKKIIKILKI